MNVEKYEVLGLRDKFPQIEKQVEERPSYDKYAENTDWVSEYVEDTYYRNPSVESVTETETKMLSEISLNKSEVANQEKTQESDSKRKTGKIARIYEAACRTCTFLRVDNDLYIKKNTVTERLNHEKLMGILFEELPGEWLSDIAALSPAKIFTVFCQAPRIPKVTYEELHRQSKGYVALNNGYYEISTGKLLPPETEIFSLDHIDADYDSSAGTPKNYLRFLSSAAGEDQSVGVRIEEVLALMIAPAIKLKQIYVFGTAPGSGKSTIADFADRLHPLGSVTRVPLQDFGANRFSGAGPIRAVMNLSMDISDEPVKEKTAAKLKEITGEKYVPYERKGKDIAVNYCITRIVAGTNHSLKILPYDKALMKRIVLVPMMISVDEDKQDPELLDKLWDEKDAIVTRLLGVLTTLSREHFKLSQCDLADQMKEAWEKESIMTYADGSVRAFVEENCVVDNMQESYSYVCDLYDAYSEYCLKIGENRKLEEAAFSKQVRLLIDISCNQKANERKRRPGAKNALHIVRGICLKGGN